MPEHTPAPTPHRAVYGFAFYVLCTGLCVAYFGWALVPQHILGDRLGLTYMPDKYFVLIISPLVSFALTLFGFVVYPAMNYAITMEPTDARTVRDAASIRRCDWRGGRRGVEQEDKHGAAAAERQRRCNRRVVDRTADGWRVVERCDRHWAEADDDERRDADSDRVHIEEEEEERRITDWCDCADMRVCVLKQRPQHVGELLALQTVPSVCDLDVSEVSRRLFGRSSRATE